MQSNVDPPVLTAGSLCVAAWDAQKEAAAELAKNPEANDTEEALFQNKDSNPKRPEANTSSLADFEWRQSISLIQYTTCDQICCFSLFHVFNMSQLSCIVLSMI